MNWKKYYKEFHNLSGSYQYYYTLKLSNYGTNEQVVEIAKNFKMKNIEKTSLFLKNAVLSGVKFMPYQIIECKELVNKDTLQLMAVKIIAPYTEEQLCTMKPYIDRITLHNISKIKEEDLPNMQYKLDLFENKKPSFLTRLGLGIFGAELIEKLIDYIDE